MRRLPSLFASLLFASLATSGCGKADAASGTKPAGNQNAGASTASVAPTALTALASGNNTSNRDSLSDSLLIAKADKGRLLGKDSSAIWVVMISDFQCPYCKQWHDATMSQVKRDYIDAGLVRMAYLHLPLPQHKWARAEAEGAMCAAVQGKFWPFADELFKRQGEIEKLGAIQPELETIGKSLALDMKAFAACQNRQAIKALVESDVSQSTRIGVRSTPSFLVGDFLVEGAVPYTDFRKAIDTALVLARSAKRSR